MQKKQTIILIGPPGSGKGTQAGFLAENFDLYYLETSKIIEANIMKAKSEAHAVVEGKKYYFSDEKKTWLTGGIVSPILVNFWIQNKIKDVAKEGKGLVLAGSPRTIPEAQRLIPFLGNLYGRENIKIIEIKLSAQQSIWRNSHRRICELMRHPILYAKETVKLTRCPLDGSRLIRRKGLDDPETIKVRLKEYKARTFPLIKYFKEKGLKVKKVNGEQSVEAVHKDIIKVIK